MTAHVNGEMAGEDGWEMHCVLSTVSNPFLLEPENMNTVTRKFFKSKTSRQLKKRRRRRPTLKPC